MKKIRKLYSYTNKRQIWRLLPLKTNKIVIEERESESKEVYFNCIEMNSGKSIFENLQLEEKFWIGIEKVYNDIIFFHKFTKPDLPKHQGIIAFDIEENKILWQNENLTFLTIIEDKLFAYQETFEGRNFFILNYKTGEILENKGQNTDKINELRESMIEQDEYSDYTFPYSYNSSDEIPAIENYKKENVITGNIEFIKKDNTVLFNAHQVNNNGTLTNKFCAIDLESEKIIFEEKLNKGIKNMIPESFFLKDEIIFLLKEKTKLFTLEIKEK